jgi:phage shock protein C
MSIYCAQCGKQNGEESRFCFHCGRPLTPEAAAYRAQVPGNPSLRTLVRPRLGRKVSGVCQGLANHYGWDVTMVRIVMLLLAIVAFPVGFILYAIIMLVAPEEPFALPATTTTSVNQS